MAQLVDPQSLPPVPRRRPRRLDAASAARSFGALCQRTELLVVRWRDVVSRIAELERTDPALGTQLRTSVYWSLEYSSDELHGCLGALEHALAEADVCIEIGTNNGLDALLAALGYEE